MRNITDLEMDELLLEIPVKPAEILNPFSPRSFSFLNPALLDFSDKTSTEPFNNR
jgi:hypothetical protein